MNASTPKPSRRGGLSIGLLSALGVVMSSGSGHAQTGGETYTRRLVASGLDRPQAVAQIGDSSVLVAERSGRVLRFEGGTRTDLGTISLPGARPYYVATSSYTEGLKDLIPVPGRSGEFLWCMTTGSAEAVRWTVGRGRITAPETMRNEVVWQSPPQPWTASNPPPFSGCRMVLDGQDVVVATGANSRAVASGRIVRVPLSGSRAPQVISTGHRNPGGVALRAGTLWEVEHGPRGGDELNVILPGRDYGWSAVSSGTPDDQYHSSFLKSRAGTTDPVFTWTPAIAPSGLTVWRDKLYVSTLQGGSVIEVTVNGNRAVSQRKALDFGTRVRDVRASRGGQGLWVLTDGPGAELYLVTPGQ